MGKSLYTMYMKITSIKKQKRDKRYSIFIDNNFAFGISEIDLLYYKLKEDMVLSNEQYNYILENLVYAKAKETAFNYISYKMRSKKEVVDKLLLEYNEEIVNKVVGLLEGYNYINDKQYAINFTKEKINFNKDGKLKIKYLLKQKGIDDLTIEQTFDEFDFENNDIVYNLICKKLRGKELDLKLKQKIYNYLLNKGFTYDQINDGFKKLED